jgi:hypothetical protein
MTTNRGGDRSAERARLAAALTTILAGARSAALARVPAALAGVAEGVAGPVGPEQLDVGAGWCGVTTLRAGDGSVGLAWLAAA